MNFAVDRRQSMNIQNTLTNLSSDNENRKYFHKFAVKLLKMENVLTNIAVGSCQVIENAKYFDEFAVEL